MTRLPIDGQIIQQKEACKILGVWISQDAGDWERNTKEICKSAYSRMSMLTKLRYPILDTRISFSVTLVLPPLIAEMGWARELWSKTKFLILEN